MCKWVRLDALAAVELPALRGQGSRAGRGAGSCVCADCRASFDRTHRVGQSAHTTQTRCAPSALQTSGEASWSSRSGGKPAHTRPGGESAAPDPSPQQKVLLPFARSGIGPLHRDCSLPAQS
eukprot:6197501-Pleurochrysis_carterae.AAC.2